MEIHICTINDASANAFALAVVNSPIFGPAQVHVADITTMKTEAVVSPANSFGFMDGGVDLAYSHVFGWHVQERLQNGIKKLPYGELPVGQALAVLTDDDNIPWLIAAPTMRTPSLILDPLVIYLAARAAMSEAIRLEFKSVAFPAMGTGVGGVPVEVAAPLMIQGICDAIKDSEGALSFPKSLRDVFLNKNPSNPPTTSTTPTTPAHNNSNKTPSKTATTPVHNNSNKTPSKTATTPVHNHPNETLSNVPMQMPAHCHKIPQMSDSTPHCHSHSLP